MDRRAINGHYQGEMGRLGSLDVWVNDGNYDSGVSVNGSTVTCKHRLSSSAIVWQDLVLQGNDGTKIRQRSCQAYN
ncbi:hypothetical protein PoB_005420200 [Plakobranchus ocellatus]|uniref:SRCR domain-containing protein n=1 Tax=Plakobranchus ocellatus TaxID=259542 RepID=A0AAV4C8J3_9GAST|nr:hypothetical protein PoB_005420200 [Plakobranchus ocellatus]